MTNHALIHAHTHKYTHAACERERTHAYMALQLLLLLNLPLSLPYIPFFSVPYSTSLSQIHAGEVMLVISFMCAFSLHCSVTQPYSAQVHTQLVHTIKTFFLGKQKRTEHKYEYSNAHASDSARKNKNKRKLARS